MTRGDVWLVNFDPTIGDEIRKTRPAVVVNDDAVGVHDLAVVVPITNWDDIFSGSPWIVLLLPTSSNGLVKPSAARHLSSKVRFDREVHKEDGDALSKGNERCI